jgi:hypothetical protein
MKITFKKNFSTLLNKYKFRAYGIHIEADNSKVDNRIIKNTIHPLGELLNKSKPELKYNYFNKLYNKRLGEKVVPNGIAIITTHSNISCLDVDKPEQCEILQQLLNDCNLIVKTRKGYHFYFNKEDILPRNECQNGIIDINTDILFYCPEYTHIKTGEIFKYEIIKSEKLNDMPEYAIKYCQTLINVCQHVKKDNKETKNKNNKISTIANIVYSPTIDIEKISIAKMKHIYNIFYNANMFNSPTDWLRVGYWCRHLNNTEESFKLFHEYSIKVEQYKNNSESVNSKGFYGNNKYNLNFETNLILLKCCKLDPINFFKTGLDKLIIDKYESKICKFESKYIKPETGENDYIFKNWIDNKKFLCLKSAYGTGKTHTFKKLIDEYKFEKILFLTYRQSLAISIADELGEQYRFTNYLNVVNKSELKQFDRLILQLDSIGHLIVGDMNDSDLEFGNYNLIVLDEIEGLLNHISFNKMNQHIIHNNLTNIINESNKVLVLDGDLSNRGLDFISSFGEDSYLIYQNTFKTTKKHFQFIHNKTYFDEEIDKDLRNGLNVAIISMTKNETVKYYTQYKELGFDCIMHNSIFRNKKILKDVNENWSKCQLLTYSPIIEAGVDFNIIGHFDKCYAIIDSHSTSYRAFCQMLNRIRNFKENNILCLMNNLDMQYRTNDILIRYDEIKAEKYNAMEITNLINILIHNDVETYNTTNYFMTSLCKMLDAKGHSYEYISDEEILNLIGEQTINIINSDDLKEVTQNEEIKEKFEDIQDDIIDLKEDWKDFSEKDKRKSYMKIFMNLIENKKQVDNILREETICGLNIIDGERRQLKGKDEILKAIAKSSNISKERFNELLKMQQSNRQISDDNILQITKYIYIKTFKIKYDSSMTQLEKDTNLALLLDCYYNKIDTINRYLNLEIDDFKIKDENDIIGKNEIIKTKKIVELLAKLDIKIINDEIINIGTEDERRNKWNEYKTIIIDFVKDKANKALFNIKREYKSINYKKCLEDFLYLYGLELNGKENKISIDGKRIKVITLTMDTHPAIDDYRTNNKKYYWKLYNDIKQTENDEHNEIKIALKTLKNNVKKLLEKELKEKLTSTQIFELDF